MILWFPKSYPRMCLLQGLSKPGPLVSMRRLSLFSTSPDAEQLVQELQAEICRLGVNSSSIGSLRTVDMRYPGAPVSVLTADRNVECCFRKSCDISRRFDGNTVQQSVYHIVDDGCAERVSRRFCCSLFGVA